MNEIKQGDIIQITQEGHAWFPCILVVDEVRSWGVQASVFVPESNNGTKKPSKAVTRLNWNEFEKVGTAVYQEENKS